MPVGQPKPAKLYLAEFRRLVHQPTQEWLMDQAPKFSDEDAYWAHVERSSNSPASTAATIPAGAGP